MLVVHHRNGQILAVEEQHLGASRHAGRDGSGGLFT